MSDAWGSKQGRGGQYGGWRGGEEREEEDRRSDYATSVDAEIHPHRRRLVRRPTLFSESGSA